MTLIGPADFYHLDYLHKPLSRGNSRRSTRPYSPSPATSRFTRRSPPKKLNMAVLDDPLLAQMAAASPLTPPAEDTLFQPLDVSLKLPDSPMAEQFADEYMESVAEEPEVDVESAHLVTHAKVYAIAEKYVCPSVISAPGFLLFLFRSCTGDFVVLSCHQRKVSEAPARCVTSIIKVPITSTPP